MLFIREEVLISSFLLINENPQEFMETAFNYFDGMYGFMKSVTFSILKTEKLEALAGFIHKNIDLDRTIKLDEIQRFDRYDLGIFFDFEDHYGKLLNSDGKEELRKHIEDVVVWEGIYP